MTTEPKFQLTGIGSLPHHNVDAALDFSFRFDVPFLPQMPLRNPWEFMLAQALEGLPGLEISSDGMPSINTDVWLSRFQTFDARLNQALKDPARFIESFEPSSAVSSTWQSFVWELQERGIKRAKIQIAGPLTAQWSLRAKDGTSLAKHPEIHSQIVKLVLLRAMAMTRRLRALKIEPLIFIDEPGIFALDGNRPEHKPMIHELSLLASTLRSEGASVGIHCCSNAQWEILLAMNIDFLSFDYDLSFASLIDHPDAKRLLPPFFKRGGKLCVGIIPTARSTVLRRLNPAELASRFYSEFSASFSPQVANLEECAQLMQSFLYSPACGLAFHSAEDAELIFNFLDVFREAMTQIIKANQMNAASPSARNPEGGST